eukprot:INCI8228.6.p1 GENE.INCI8228.6~~INCI8228.6.p1  ORF type:complete len:323 (+),score=49.43 INCI8228.6:155-1123(+)
MEVELASVAGDAGSRKKTESSSNTLDAGGESRPQKAVAGATPPTAPSPVESRCICSRVPFCWVGKKLASGTCRCVQGTSCNACAVCGWIGVVCVTALALLFLVGYFPCLSLPVYALADESTLKQFVPIHEDPSQPLQAQNRSSHGIVSILSYNIYQRPGPITDWDTAEFNDYKAERLDDLAATFDEFDILLLQESWVVLSQGRKNKLVSVAKEKGFPFYVRGRCTGKPVTSMLNIFSRHPLVDAAEHSFVNSCCDEAMASKGVVAATVWINGNESHKVNLYTTHLMVRSLTISFHWPSRHVRVRCQSEIMMFAQKMVLSGWF